MKSTNISQIVQIVPYLGIYSLTVFQQTQQWKSDMDL